MIKVKIPFIGRQCNCCHGEIDILEYDFRSDFSNSGTAVALCKECRIKLRELLFNELTVEQHKLQKPLTLDEALHEVSIWFECGVVGKSYFFDFTPAFIYKIDDELVDIYRENGNVFSQHIENYMKCWRCWATKPTEEERAAAKWEE